MRLSGQSKTPPVYCHTCPAAGGVANHRRRCGNPALTASSTSSPKSLFFDLGEAGGGRSPSLLSLPPPVHFRVETGVFSFTGRGNPGSNCPLPLQILQYPLSKFVEFGDIVPVLFGEGWGRVIWGTASRRRGNPSLLSLRQSPPVQRGGRSPYPAGMIWQSRYFPPPHF